MASNLTQTQQYKIKQAVIKADRFGDYEVDIGRMIMELSLFEHIEKSYCTGQIVVLDDSGIFETINFKGTETFELVLGSVTAGLGSQMFPAKGSKVFHITAVERQVQSGDKSTVYVFNLIEYHGYVDKAIRISKAYTGKVESIISALIANDLQTDIDLTFSVPSSQPEMKVIIPYLTPLQASEWLRDRATSKTGAPYFLFSSLYDDRVRLYNLELLLQQPAFNKRPYLYSRAGANSVVDGNELDKAFVVESVDFGLTDDNYNNLRNGIFGATITNIDTFSGYKLTSQYKVSDLLNKLKNQQVFSDTGRQDVWDEKHEIKAGVKSDQLPARNFFQVTSSKTYDANFTYHDVETTGQLKTKLENNSLRSLLNRRLTNIVVPGSAVMLGQRSPGDIIRVEFMSTNVRTNSTSKKDLLDPVRSGDYMIYSTRHVFKDTTHKVSMQITKLERNQLV
jgi:hypothetical protein